ncbi:MAG TPA: hypothetical protein VIJ26_13185 [Thermoanaerobaculia bacterium]|jgi:hypothetical protein
MPSPAPSTWEYLTRKIYGLIAHSVTARRAAEVEPAVTLRAAE